MDEEPKDDRHLDVKYEHRLKQMKDGSFRVERSAEATLRDDDRKQNPRHTPEGAKADRDLRRQKEEPGMDVWHKMGARWGPKEDERNYDPGSRIMNRRFMNEWENETNELLKEKGQLDVKVTSIHRANESGEYENRPIAFKLEREGDPPNSELYVGNFSSKSQRLHEQMPEGQKPTREQMNDTYREESAAYTEGKNRQRDTNGQRLSRAELKKYMRENSVDGGKKDQDRSK